MRIVSGHTVWESDDGLTFEINLGGTRSLNFFLPTEEPGVVTLSVVDEVGSLEVAEFDAVALSMLSDAIELMATVLGKAEEEEEGEG